MPACVCVCVCLCVEVPLEGTASIRFAAALYDETSGKKTMDTMSEIHGLVRSLAGRAFALAGEDQFSVWAKKRIKTRPFNKPICQNLGTLCCFRTTTNHQ